MTASDNPYDQYPYRSAPVEWSAPERLALTSLLHGGPRASLQDYRLLELGCGDGSNLLPLAHYRRNAWFVGVDGSRAAIATADARRRALQLPNLELVHADFLAAESTLKGSFDYIIAHGVFSWVSETTRESLFRLCARCLRKNGLLYLNYNTHPGWKIRGLIRTILRSHTGTSSDLASRAEAARGVCLQLTAALDAAREHPFLKLIQRELEFVLEAHPSYVAHEFLAEENHAFWRSEFLALARQHGFHYVADADFNRDSGRVPQQLIADMRASALAGADLEDVMTYRQLHSPIFSRSDAALEPAAAEEIDQLYVAASLSPCASDAEVPVRLRHASGCELEVRDASMLRVLSELASIWPRGRRVFELFGRQHAPFADLRLMDEHGLIELRMIEPEADPAHAQRLNQHELAWGGYATTPTHVPYAR